MGLTRQEIAFSGDVMNTAARIQSECRPRNEFFLISRDAFERMEDPTQIDLVFSDQGSVTLRGKTRNTSILSVSLANQSNARSV